MANLGKRIPLQIAAGVSPIEDSTELDTIYFTDSDKVRFQNGKLRKIKGWQRIFAPNFQRIQGAARNIFSYNNTNGNPIVIVGTHTRLYAVIQSSFYNITPLKTDTTVIADAFTTEYQTGGLTIATTEGSSVVTVIATNYLLDNESVTLSGFASDINGIPSANFNNTFNAKVIDNTQFQINVGAEATSTGLENVSGVVMATGYLYVNYPNHGLLVGDRINLALATDVGNILAAAINGEQIITNVVDLDTFVFQTGTIASSLVGDGGGASTTIQVQIASGNVDQSLGYGYGGGLYGMGLYGTSLAFTTTNSYPRIWSMDTLGNQLICCPGDAATISTPNIYVWDNDLTTAPTLLSNAPDAARWVFVSNGAVCALGCDGVLNRFSSSDIGDGTNWTPDATSYAYTTDIEQASPLISQASARNKDLHFSENEVYQVEFVEKPFIWYITKLLTTDGLIAPKARCSIEDAVFWMGRGDFFVYDGTSINILPNNTVKRHVYNNLNLAQAYKIFAYPNTTYNEVWWFYCAGDDNEPNNYVMYNYKEQHWTIGTLRRTAGEEPINVFNIPLMIESEVRNTVNLPDSLTTHFFTLGADPLTTTDTSQDIEVSVTADCYLYDGDYVLISGAVDTNGIPASDINGIKQISDVIYSGELATGFTIQSASASATSSGTGGGSAITIGTSIISINTDTFAQDDFNYYIVAPNDGIDTTNGSRILSITLPGYVNLIVGTLINITGATDTNGIPASDINGLRRILSVTHTYPIDYGGYGYGLYGINVYGIIPYVYGALTTTFTFLSGGSSATLTGSGGGSNINVGLMVANFPPNFSNVNVNDLIDIAYAQDIGGIDAQYINYKNVRIRFKSGASIEVSTNLGNLPTAAFSTNKVSDNGGTYTTITYKRTNRLFQHEVGYNDYNNNFNYITDTGNDQYAPMYAYARTNFAQIGDGDSTMLIYSIYPDSNQINNLSLTAYGKLYAQSANTITRGAFTLTPTTIKVDIMLLARQRQYLIESNVLDSDFVIGKWFEEIKPSSPR